MAEKLTIRDIARLAGVSKSTVSRVLNRSNNVDPVTRERVLHIMDENDFVPSIAATELARGRNRLIGMLVPALTWPFMPDVIQGVAGVIEETPYEIILYSMNPQKDFRHVVDRVMATNLTAGMLAILHTHSPQHLIELHEHGLPVVLINTTATRVSLPWVCADDVGGAYTATRHLLDLGHRRIGFVYGPEEIQCSHDRYQGYCKALSEAGLSIDPRIVLQGEFSDQGGMNCAREFYALPAQERPTAIFASNDPMAMGVLSAAEELGWQVPEEVAVVGFDDITPAAHTRPPLTTIRQPFQEMGRRAAQILLSIIDENYTFSEAMNGTSAALHREGEDESLHIHLPTKLVVRETCGASQ